MVSSLSLCRMFTLCILYALTTAAVQNQETNNVNDKDPWTTNYASQGDLPYSGIVTFAHLEAKRCLTELDARYDIAIIGAPFDTTVTFRTGARFGPKGIRDGSRRQRAEKAYSVAHGINPYAAGPKVMDCGDVPMNPYDPAVAIAQLEAAYTSLLNRPPIQSGDPYKLATMSLDGKSKPRLVTLGGDHTIVLPNLRALAKVYGPISVIHFDAHLDTWDPDAYLGSTSAQSRITHGTFFAIAAEENLLGPSVHLGIRTRLDALSDYEFDKKVGFQVFSTDDIDEMGANGLAAAAKARIGDRPCYISLDIDVVDPSAAPASGTLESGGWTPREVKKIIRGLQGLNIVGVDVVEVSPPFDTNAEITSILAADLVYEFLGVMVNGPDALPGGAQAKVKALRDEL